MPGTESADEERERSDWRKPKEKRRVYGGKAEIFRRLSEGESVNAEDASVEIGCSPTTVLNAVRMYGREVANLQITRVGRKSFYQVSAGELRRLDDEEEQPAVPTSRNNGPFPELDSTLTVNGINRDPRTRKVFIILYYPVLSHLQKVVGCGTEQCAQPPPILKEAATR